MNKQPSVLLYVDNARIEGIKNAAAQCAAKLNALCEVFPFTSQEEHAEIFSAPQETFNELMRRADPMVSQIEHLVPIKQMTIPAALQDKFKALGLAGGPAPWSNFQNVKFDAKVDRWIPDQEAIEQVIEEVGGCRAYMTTAEQLERFEVSKSLAKWLNRSRKKGPADFQHEERRRFEGLLRYSMSGKHEGRPWHVNPSFIFTGQMAYKATEANEKLDDQLRELHPLN